MTRLMRDFAWGTLESGFVLVDGVFRTNHPRYSRGGATYVSSHGAIVTSDYRLPFDKPLKFLAPVRLADRKEAMLTSEGLEQASEMQFSMAGLVHGRYRPFDEQTGLFRKFSAVRSSADVVAFANHFGPLGADLSIAIVDGVAGDPSKMGLELYWAEPIAQWLAEAEEMARIISLWDLIRAGDRNVFVATLTRGAARLRIKTGQPDYKHIEKDWVLAKAKENSKRFQEVSRTDTHDWPQLLLKQWIDRGVRGRTAFGVSGKDLKATVTPNGLIGALWLQASLAIDGNVDFQQCRECGDWFGISAEHARPEKLFCSNACRMRAYRLRKKDKKETRSHISNA